MADLRLLPNLAALRAFEAAARHGNFSRAAEEIHVTHGAISHQVRALEEELGLQLFSRHGKRITITPDGQQFADVVRKNLMDIATAADVLKASSRQQRLTVTALPSFAARFLSPRLGSFIENNADLEIMLQSSTHFTDFQREPVDVSIRFGSGGYPGLAEERLMTDHYYPVVSPKFNRGQLPKTPQDLVLKQLMRCEMEPWQPWFQAAGVDLPEPTGGVMFQDASLLIRAAVDGLGIALVRHAMVDAELRSGELVRLFDISTPCAFSYYFICLPQTLQKPQVQAFRTWLFEEVAKVCVPVTERP